MSHLVPFSSSVPSDPSLPLPSSPSQPQRSDFYSTTSAPLLGGISPPLPDTPVGGGGGVGIIGRGRPKALPRGGSFFGAEPSDEGHQTSFGSTGEERDEGDLGPRGGQTFRQSSNPDRSSFYGLNDPSLPPSSATEGASGAAGGGGGNYQAQSNSSQLPQRTIPGGFDSSSSSSHDLRPQTSSTFLSPQSRVGSIYLLSSSSEFPPPLPPPAQLLDQSHLRPGILASLLSHEKTLDLYRTNAKKTGDADVQFEFCTFVMEVVGSLDPSSSSPSTAGGGGEEGEEEGKRRQKALVLESVGLLSKLANRGHVKSQYFLADCYTQGIGTLKVSPLPTFPLQKNVADARGGVRINVILIKLFLYLFWRENMVMWTLVIVLLNAVRTDGDVKKISQKPVFSYGTSSPPLPPPTSSFWEDIKG